MYTVSLSLPGVGAAEVLGDAYFFTPKRGLYSLWEFPLLPHLCQAVRVGDRKGAIVSIKGISFIGALQ